MPAFISIRAFWPALFFCLSFLGGCITPDNEVLEGLGTPDVNRCSSIPGVENGADYRPRDAITLGVDNRTHPDVFYMGWAQLDARSDLRFPQAGYDGNGFEDKLLVTRKTASPVDENDATAGNLVRTWQLLPHLDNNCEDIEKIRIHSFDVAPNGRSLYVSMAQDGDSHLGIYRLDLETGDLAKISQENDIHFMYPTYVGNDPDTKHEMLVVAKTVTADDIPHNYAQQRFELVDEYDRAPTPLIHTMDSQTGETVRIGFNNSHQTEPFVMVGPDGNRIVVFTQWEHQDNVNRFSLWKTQIDGSDNFTFFGQESAVDKSAANLFQARAVRSGDYKGYVLMTEGHNKFDAEGHIAMTYRHHQELRSERHYLQKVGSANANIGRSPEHYNDDSFIYSLRESSEYTYKLYIKDFPENIPETGSVNLSGDKGVLLTPEVDTYHFVQARSYYPPERELIAPTNAADLGENRVSFTNEHLNGRSGFLVQDLTQSDNGVQHQLDGLSPEDISMQFFIPSHHFGDSNTTGVKSSPEMSIPASDFILPEKDGSMGVVMKDGLYVWKVNKRFNHGGQEGPGGNDGEDIWLPVRSELQEISFVPNRVNACNQCHQERDEANLHLYTNLSETIAEQKMKGDLSDVTDISNYYAAGSVPDFHKDIMPLFTDPKYKGPTGKTCAECHDAGTKLDLSNTTGPEARNSVYRTLILGAHRLPSGATVAYSNDSINPLGMDGQYSSAPFFWGLLLNDDLAPEQSGSVSRALVEVGDYGASYNREVKNEISRINQVYDHSKHWPAATIQKFITYSSTQMPAGLSDRITFQAEGNSNAWRRTGAAAQKAYQAMVRSCFSCHNSFTQANGEGIEDPSFGLPEDKRFSNTTGMRDRRMRFMVHNHVAKKNDTKYSQLLGQSNLTTSMYQTLLSATYQIDFSRPEQSSLLKHALGLSKTDPREGGATSFVNHSAVLQAGDADYAAIHNWVTSNWTGIENLPPQIDSPNVVAPIVLEEYGKPQFLDLGLVWSDPDSSGNPVSSHDLANSGKEYAQLYMNNGTRHSMLALEYRSFNTADLEAYAILGDAQKTSIEVIATDGQQTSAALEIPVQVTTDYIVPEPSTVFPDAYAFYTTRRVTDANGTVLQAGGELHKLSTDNGIKSDEVIGNIAGYSNDWSTVYRRSDRGWLYFLNQNAQSVHVVDEKTAELLFEFKLDLSASKETDNHKQTVYLLWWRPNDGDGDGQADDMDHLGNTQCPHGELQALVESKLSETRNGDYYIGLGCGELLNVNPSDKVTETMAHLNVVDPVNDKALFDTLKQAGHSYTYQTPTVYRTKLQNGSNTLAVYSWRRATFMSRWVNEGVDELNVLNLVTGKDKELGDFKFPEKIHNGVVFPQGEYFNVRAIVVAEDGAFYGFNKDINDNVVNPATMFNFDPVNEIQQPVTTPEWVDEYITNSLARTYGTPFLVIEPRSAQP